MDIAAVLVITVELVAFGLVSRRIDGSIVTGPILFTVIGVVAGPAARWFGAIYQRMGDCEENRPVSDEPFM